MAHCNSPEALSCICHRLVSWGRTVTMMGYMVSCPLGPMYTRATPAKLSLPTLAVKVVAGLKPQVLMPCPGGSPGPSAPGLTSAASFPCRIGPPVLL